MKQLTDFPRISLGLFPTPIHRLDNLSRLLGVQVFLKRDDLSGLGLGGNKIRKLEFLLADAEKQEARKSKPKRMKKAAVVEEEVVEEATEEVEEVKEVADEAVEKAAEEAEEAAE